MNQYKRYRSILKKLEKARKSFIYIHHVIEENHLNILGIKKNV